MKTSLVWIISITGGLYTTLVLMNLWNWFVVPAFNTPAISFWLMFGLLQFLTLIVDRRNELEEEFNWKGATIMLDACIPESRRSAVKEQLDLELEDAWRQVGFKLAARLLGNTVVLVLGWAVHTFLL